MSVQDQIDRLHIAKTDIANAISEKGVSVPSGTKLDGMAALIGEIQNGTDTLAAFVEGATEITCNASFVGSNVFRGNAVVTKATFPVATTLEANSFYYNTTIREVYAPEAVTVGVSAFIGATKLEKVDVSKATKFETSAFQGCTALSQLICPNMETMGYTSLLNCKALEELYLPNIKQLNTNFCGKCTALQYVELGSVSQNYYMFASSFSECTNLTALVIRATKLVTLANANAFADTPIANGTGYIYIPSSLIPTFQSATNWTTLANQFRALEDYTVDGTVTGAFDRSKI